MRRGLVVMAVLLTACGGRASATQPDDDLPSHKVFVCKYVGKPGVDERLQTGQNPISVDVSALEGPPVIGQFFEDRQGRSVVIAFDTGQPEPGVDACPNVTPPTTTTTEKPHVTTTTEKPHVTTTTAKPTTTTSVKPTTTTSSTSTTVPATTTTKPSTTTTTQPGSTTTTTFPPMGQFGFNAASVCPPNGVPSISITFGNRPDLNGQTGTLEIIAGPSETLVSTQPLTFQSNQVVLIPYPALPAGSTDALLRYSLAGEVETAIIDLPLTNCATTTTSSTTTTIPVTTTTAATTTTTSTTLPGTTTSSGPSTTTTTLPGATTTTTTLPPGQPFTFGAASTICIAEVPTIRIIFASPAQFPSLVGQTGTLTMNAINGGALLSTQPLVYTPGATIDILYPGTVVNADGSIADVPGWILQPNGLWVLDPSDTFLRDGILLTYVLNPTATATVSYPPESSTCANPENPPRPPGAPPAAPPRPGLPPTGNSPWTAAIAALTLALGSLLAVVGRRRRA